MTPLVASPTVVLPAVSMPHFTTLLMTPGLALACSAKSLAACSVACSGETPWFCNCWSNSWISLAASARLLAADRSMS
jgi:hypothetical protein